MEFCKDAIGGFYAGDISIYPVSATLALRASEEADHEKLVRSGLPELAGVLAGISDTDKRATLVHSTISKASRVANSLYASNQVAIASADMAGEHLEDTLKRVEDFLGVVESERRELLHLLEGRFRAIVDALDEDLSRFKADHEAAFHSAIQSYAREELESKRGVREVEVALQKRLAV